MSEPKKLSPEEIKRRTTPKYIKTLRQHKLAGRQMMWGIPIVIGIILLIAIGNYLDNGPIILFGAIAYIAMVIIYMIIVVKELLWRYGNNDGGEPLELEHLRMYFIGKLAPEGEPIFEIHHKAGGLGEAFALRKQSKADTIAKLKQGFRSDFVKLQPAQEGIVLAITTHPSFAHILKDAVKDIATMDKIHVLLDPLGEMTRTEWMQASFYTTGRLNASRPDELHSYVFHFHPTEQ